MTLALQRFFGQTKAHFQMPFMVPARTPVDQIKLRFRALLIDCDDHFAKRVGYRVNGAVTADELWQLRNELHQCISQRYSQSEAARRVNSLLPEFEGWIPAGQLTAI